MIAINEVVIKKGSVVLKAILNCSPDYFEKTKNKFKVLEKESQS